jgi:hypothetical protein
MLANQSKLQACKLGLKDGSYGEDKMAAKRNWMTLSHEQRVRALREMSIDEIVKSYKIEGQDEVTFRQGIGRELQLWSPQNVSQFEHAGDAPTKDVVLGAWRDLDRSEALLELIDNSIDVWLQRKEQYPKKTAPELNIYIDLHRDLHQIMYEDNAGGVSRDKLENLVVPGHSDTTAFTRTIGSYKTGGKKAIFRLAEAAQITSRYWNPAETSDEAISVQLDQNWINDPRKYEFPYAVLKDKSVIERGQTRYVLQLREEPIGGTQWFEEPDKVDKILKEIRSAYTLLFIRNPAIHIHLLDRAKPLEPLESLYDFSGTTQSGIDIRPQQVIFETQLEYEGRTYPLDIEIVLGCRTSTGIRDQSPSWGIDLYGNDRLFVSYDQNTFSHLLQTGNSKTMIRGFVNIRGANVFIPWDTHKRHLNLDREIVNVITKHPLVVELFENWKKAYLAISRSGKVTEIINNALPQVFDRRSRDLTIPHRDRVQLYAKRKRGLSLPKTVFKPRVKERGTKATATTISLKLTFNTDEARSIASYYGITGDLSARSTNSELASEIKGDVLKRARKTKK